MKTGIESTADSAALSTSFAIPAAPASGDVANVDLRFNDINRILRRDGGT